MSTENGHSNMSQPGNGSVNSALSFLPSSLAGRFRGDAMTFTPREAAGEQDYASSASPETYDAPVSRIASTSSVPNLFHHSSSFSSIATGGTNDSQTDSGSKYIEYQPRPRSRSDTDYLTSPDFDPEIGLLKGHSKLEKNGNGLKHHVPPPSPPFGGRTKGSLTLQSIPETPHKEHHGDKTPTFKDHWNTIPNKNIPSKAYQNPDNGGVQLPSTLRYQPPALRKYRGETLEDPFSSSTPRPTIRSLSALQDQSLHDQSRTSATASAEKAPMSAKDLAEFIRSGALDLGDDSPDKSDGSAHFGVAHLGATPRSGRVGTMSSFDSALARGSPLGDRGLGYNHFQNGPLRSVVPQPKFNPGPDPIVRQFKERGGPTYDEMIRSLPFTATAQFALPSSSAGVVRITDIPYSTARKEIVAFFGRQARFVMRPAKSPYYAIHIVMERSTAKSMDCFVEFQSEIDAVNCVRRVEKNNQRRPKIGDRYVSIDVVDQGQLMKALFPKAKYVEWEGCLPHVSRPKRNGDQWSSDGFKGFISNEELHMTVKYAQDPKRSRYALKHMQRTYESMISLLSKYPWAHTKLYTLGERDAIFKATEQLISDLQERIIKGQCSDVLTPMLLEELVLNALECPGFSEQQKASIADQVQCTNIVGVPVCLTPLAKCWPFLTLNCDESASEEMVIYFASMIKEASSGAIATSPFGGFAIALPSGATAVSFGEIIQWELKIVHDLLFNVCRPEGANFIPPTPVIPHYNAYGGAPMFNETSIQQNFNPTSGHAVPVDTNLFSHRPTYGYFPNVTEGPRGAAENPDLTPRQYHGWT